MRLLGRMTCLGLFTFAACSASERAASTSAAPNEAQPDRGPSGPTGTGAPGEPGGPAPGGAGGPDSEPPRPYVPFDVNHVLSTGQSNSVAHEGRPVISTAQPCSNLMFDVGVMTSGNCEREGCRTYQKPSAFVPLVEGDMFWYPVETMSAGLGNEAAMLARTKYGQASHDVLVSLAGR